MIRASRVRRQWAGRKKPEEPREPPLPLASIPLLPDSIAGPPSSGRVHPRPPRYDGLEQRFVL